MKKSICKISMRSAAFLASIVIIAGCTGERINQEDDWLRPDVFHGRYATYGNLSVGTSFTAIFTVTPDRDVAGVVMTITIPEQIDVLAGDRYWQGNLESGKPVNLSLQLRVNQPGEWQLRTHVSNTTNIGWRRTYSLFINSSYEQGFATDYPTTAPEIRQVVNKSQ